MCVREWLSAGDKDKYNVYMRVFTCLYQSWTTTRGQTERESGNMSALCQGQPASLTLSFFHARVHTTQLLIDQLLLLQSSTQYTVRLNCLCTLWKWWFTLFIDLHASVTAEAELSLQNWFIAALNDLCNWMHTCHAHCVCVPMCARRAPVNCYCTLHCKSMQLIMHNNKE